MPAILGLSLILMSPGGWAQKQTTGQELQSSPDSFNGQKVSIYVDNVIFPAKRIDAEHGFSDYWVVTASDSHVGKSSLKGNRTVGDRDWSGGVFVRVPASQTEEFSKTHAIKAGQANSGSRKKIVGVFRAVKSGKGGFLDLTDGSSKDVEPPPRNSFGNGGQGPRHGGDLESK